MKIVWSLGFQLPIGQSFKFLIFYSNYQIIIIKNNAKSLILEVELYFGSQLCIHPLFCGKQSKHDQFQLFYFILNLIIYLILVEFCAEAIVIRLWMDWIFSSIQHAPLTLSYTSTNSSIVYGKFVDISYYFN